MAFRRKKAANADGNMTLREHFSELRNCILIVAGSFLAATVASYFVAPRFVRMCLDLAEGYTFVQTAPAELMGQYLKMSVIVGVVVALPVLIWQAHRFASPGLKKNEDRVFLGVMLSGVLFFGVGAVFCYFIVLPFMLQFFLSLNTIDVLGMYSVREYMSYLFGVIVAFGVIFEIPVLASVMALAGLLKAPTMVKGRRLVIVLNFVVGAIITPTDVVSQLLVALPMCLLYEVAIVCVRLISARRAARHPEEVQEEERNRERMQSERRTRWARASAMAERERQEKEKKK